MLTARKHEGEVLESTNDAIGGTRADQVLLLKVDLCTERCVQTLSFISNKKTLSSRTLIRTSRCVPGRDPTNLSAET